jgi:hypothetical protein
MNTDIQNTPEFKDGSLIGRIDGNRDAAWTAHMMPDNYNHAQRALWRKGYAYGRGFTDALTHTPRG